MQARGTSPLRLIIALAAASAILQASAQAQPAPSGPVTFHGVTFPEQIGGADRISVRDYERTDPGLGYSAGYRYGAWISTVYVYDLGLAQVPGDVRSPVIRQQFEQARRDIYGRRQWGDAVAFDHEFAISDGQNRPRLACASFAITREGRDTASFLCVGGVNDKFLKFRITGPRRSDAEAQARRFIDAWVQVLWPIQ
jgi:hypothetical protein